MTDQEINIAIAKACGWRFVPEHDRMTPQGHEVAGYPQRWIGPDNMEYFEDIPYPDYCNDLNAMHEAWQTLTEPEHHKWTIILQGIVQRDGHITGPCRSVSNATARQRADAFLRVKKLWVEAGVAHDATQLKKRHRKT